MDLIHVAIGIHWKVVLIEELAKIRLEKMNES